MPYNNTPIAPNKEITGHVSLPLARVQKIIQSDPERLTTSKNAAFAIALATEMFIQHLAITTHNVVKTERKPRRNIQYRDVSAAVAKTDNLEFLVDVAPKTATWGSVRKRVEAASKGKEAEKGQMTLDGGVDKEMEKGDGKEVTPATTVEATSDAMDVDGEETERVEDSEPEVDAAAAMQIEMEMRGPPRQATASASASPEVKRSSGFTAINGAK
ncbi:hypothetical protein BDW02DRAFT_570481 [Decorospora gaudefroyi]|uniref:Transcription factor CBF/NF-Y/archaeal histone domain-containing protein n=1 Tax=Decorospora gaudefroyi TaxID=184978 RepID=A0A6A5KET1_9PLEO|nr:hypothetical protein BDW02DRAFT_570481 [Decorospora gaudefroyi]